MTFSRSEGLARIGDFVISFQRSDLRTGTSFGHAPFDQVQDFDAEAPLTWSRDRSVFLHVPEGEAVWLGFSNPASRHAVQVVFNDVDAASGQPSSEHLTASPQNYVVCPPQLWLDGIYSEDQLLRTFYPDREMAARLDTRVYEVAEPSGPTAPITDRADIVIQNSYADSSQGSTILAIARDPVGPQGWRPLESFCAYVIGPQEYKRITGRQCHPKPGSDDIYTGFRLP